MSERRFRYQITPGILLAGDVSLTFILLLLFSALSDGVPSSIWWWIFTVTGSILLLFSIHATFVILRITPIELILTSDNIDLPSGHLGTQRILLPLVDIKGIRIIGKMTATRHQKAREALYVLHGDDYTTLMSDMFDHHSEYLDFKKALCRNARSINPCVILEVDGKRLEEDLSALNEAWRPKK